MQLLEAFASNVTSQSGEDGILAEIFARIGVVHRSCVEFGAWDGKHLSNTWSLWHEDGWRALLIEGHPDRHAALAKSLGDFPKVSALCAYVQPEGEYGLDALISRFGLERNFDLLCVDVDGDDYHIWRGLNEFRPRVVVIEYNPTIPPELELVQRRGGYFGASARALVSLARAKGYRLAACTKTNCIFVENAHWEALDISGASLEDIFPRDHLTYVINAYDGRTYLNRVPTYSAALSVLTPGVLVQQLRASLKNTSSVIESPVETRSAIAPVYIFALPERRVEHGLPQRLAGYLWRVFLKSSVGAPAREANRRWRAWRYERVAIAEWERQGRPAPPPHAYKQSVVRQYARRYGLKVLVETGTYLGDMVEAMRRQFRQIYSIELDPRLYDQATRRFAACERVKIVQGDSGTVLPQILSNLAEAALFWLDGHYSADITAKGDKNTPIANELRSISMHQIKHHVILIDDARCFDGTNDYPTVAELQGVVREYWPGSSFDVRDDIVRIVPTR